MEEILEKVESAHGHLRGAWDKTDPKKLDESFHNRYRSSLKALDFLLEALPRIDPLLVPQQAYNGLNKQLEAASNHGQTLADAPMDDAALGAVHSSLLSALLHLAQIPTPAAGDELRISKAELERFRTQCSEMLDGIEQKTSQISEHSSGAQKQLQTEQGQARERLNEIGKQIESQKQRIDQVVNDLQSQFSEAEEQRRKEFGELIEQTKSWRNDADRTAKEAEDARESKFSVSQEDHRKRIDDMIHAAEEFIAGKREEVVAELQALQSQAERIVTVITNTGMIGGYQSQANQESRKSFWWSMGTVVSLVGLISTAVWAVSGLGESPAWAAFAGRAFVAAGFGILAAYAARQADQHARKERHFRQTELELASIGPFLANLPEGEQHRVIGEVSGRYFGGTAVDDSEEPATRGNLVDIVEMLARQVVELAKRK